MEKRCLEKYMFFYFVLGFYTSWSMTRRKVNLRLDEFLFFLVGHRFSCEKKHVLKSACFFRSFLKIAKDRGLNQVDFHEFCYLTVWSEAFM